MSSTIEPSDKDRIEKALTDLILYARHPLRQITIQQASVTFTDDVTPSACLPDTNAFKEGSLVRELLHLMHHR